MIGPISLDMKRMGARSAGNPHAACDVEGAGNVARSNSSAKPARQSSTLLMSGEGKRTATQHRAPPRLYRESSSSYICAKVLYFACGANKAGGADRDSTSDLEVIRVSTTATEAAGHRFPGVSSFSH